MGEFAGYMLFSLIEGMAVFALSLYIFRFDLKKYLWPTVIVITAINLQSFVIREELSLKFISPVINIVFMLLFFTIYLRIPFLWSTLMTVTGYMAFGVIQNLFVFLSFGYLSIHEVQSTIWKGYLLQTLSGFLGFAIGWVLYQRGLGFAYEFEKLRFSWERVIIILVTIVFLIALAIMMYFKSVFTNLVVLAVSLFFFLIYSLRKEVNGR